MSWSISTFSAAKEMEEQTESAGVLFTGCYLQVDVYPKHVCMHYIKSDFKCHATFIQLLALFNSFSIYTVAWVQPHIWEDFVYKCYVHILIVTAERDIWWTIWRCYFLTQEQVHLYIPVWTPWLFVYMYDFTCIGSVHVPDSVMWRYIFRPIEVYIRVLSVMTKLTLE